MTKAAVLYSQQEVRGPFCLERERRKDPWGIGEKVLCLQVGLTLIFIILIYSDHLEQTPLVMYIVRIREL